MRNDIGYQLNNMIKHHRMVLRKPKKNRNITCGIKQCGNKLTNLVYRIDKLNRKHLCGMCDKHGFTFHPLINGLDIPEVRTRLKSKKKRGLRKMTTQTQTLF